MRLCLITNPASGSYASLDALRPLLEQAGAEEWQSEGPAHTTMLAQAAAREGRFDAVVACGGDGTINEVVNGLMAAPLAQRPALGILPLGTGNDLARTLLLPEDHRDALALLLCGVTVPLDVFHLKAPDADRYGVNMAAGGFSGAVSDALSEDLKKRWGPLAYLIGAMKALPELTPFDLRVTLDEGAPMTMKAFNVFVANGRYVAGGKLVDPDAEVGDGQLDVVIIKDGTGAEMAALTARFMAGQHHGSSMVEMHRARTVEISAEPGMLFNVDGELVTQEPILFRLHPSALRVLVPG